MKSCFIPTENKLCYGFNVRFDNNYRISVQFTHYNNYENKLNSTTNRYDHTEYYDAEVAIFYDKDEHTRNFVTGNILAKMMLNLPHDDEVAYRVTPNEVARIISYVSNIS